MNKVKLLIIADRIVRRLDGIIAEELTVAAHSDEEQMTFVEDFEFVSKLVRLKLARPQASSPSTSTGGLGAGINFGRN